MGIAGDNSVADTGEAIRLVRCPSGGIPDAELNSFGMITGDENAAGAVALIKITFRGFQQRMFGGQLQVFCCNRIGDGFYGLLNGFDLQALDGNLESIRRPSQIYADFSDSL
jgi:hypothetical protein